METTAIIVMIFGTVFLLGGALYFIKLAYDNTKKKKTGEKEG
ncbi:MAG: MetS family NSS transporter small subunit [Deltaproteobacteria bacterium]|nr:MetS family NSS transporter small subunit [Deltaproteobacteria bacterium]